MKIWLEKAIFSLGKAKNSLCQFGSSVIITCCYNECLKSQSLKKENIISLVGMLGLFSDIKAKIMQLMEMIPPKFRYMMLSFLGHNVHIASIILYCVYPVTERCSGESCLVFHKVLLSFASNG